MAEPDAAAAGSEREGDPVGDGSENEADRLVARVRELLLSTLAIEVLDPDEDLMEGGLLDSLALVELLFELERTFDVAIVVGELDVESFRTIARIAHFVAGRQLEARG